MSPGGGVVGPASEGGRAAAHPGTGDIASWVRGTPPLDDWRRYGGAARNHRGQDVARQLKIIGDPVNVISPIATDGGRMRRG
jgi:hypothetical protein